VQFKLLLLLSQSSLCCISFVAASCLTCLHQHVSRIQMYVPMHITIHAPHPTPIALQHSVHVRARLRNTWAVQNLPQPDSLPPSPAALFIAPHHLSTCCRCCCYWGSERPLQARWHRQLQCGTSRSSFCCRCNFLNCLPSEKPLPLTCQHNLLLPT